MAHTEPTLPNGHRCPRTPQWAAAALRRSEGRRRLDVAQFPGSPQFPGSSPQPQFHYYGRHNAAAAMHDRLWGNP
ncbi:hypothetical protein D7B24_005284, partial [Verticillium nonalfalfae]